MPKQKRTRKQKMQADIRKETPSFSQSAHEVTSGQYSLSQISLPKTIPKQTPKTTTTTISTSEYTYLGSDLRKTTLVMAVIIVIELLLRYFILKS